MRRVPLILTALVLATAALAQSAWQTTTAPGGVFTFDMPGKPAYSTKIMATSKLPKYTMHDYRLENGPAAYGVQTAIFPKGYDFSDAKAALAAIVEGTVNIKHRNERWFTYQGLPAVELVGELGNGGYAIRDRTMFKGQRYVSLTYFGPPGTAMSPQANQFLDSLKLK